MTEAPSDDEARIKVREMLEQIRTVMLVTHDPDGGLDARPMAILAVEGDTVWFFTGRDTPKTFAIDQDHAVLLAGANPSGQGYVSVRGRARVMQDRAQQKALWTEAARLWFPDGAGSPDLALIAVEMTEAQYWDSPASTARYAIGYVKAVLTKTPPEMGENAKVTFGGG